MAGLLDGLFNPAAFSGTNGGLLDFLRTAQMQQNNYQPSAGFPQDQPSPLDTAQWPAGPVGAPPQAAAPLAIGGYQMPRIGPQAAFTPDPAALPQNAQPTQGQLPQGQPQPGFFDRLNSGLQSIGNGGSVIGALTGNPTDTPNLTQRFFVQRGFDPGLAKAITSDPGLLRAVLPQMLGISGQTDDIKEYQFAKQQEPNLTFKDFMNRKRAVSGEYSLTPQYGTDKDGNTVLVQTGKSGEAIQTKLPDGVKISSGVEKIDAGDHWILYDKRTGSPVGTQPKNIEAREAAEVRGKAQGEATVALPGAISDAEQTKKKIDELLTNEGLDSIVGPLDQFRPSWTLGEKGRDALARYNQLKGSAFLSAYGLLRGGGAITEVEGKKAEDAMARMDRAQSEDDFKTALRDFRDAIDVGVAKLRAKAGNGAAPASSSSPAVPPDLKKKYGLD